MEKSKCWWPVVEQGMLSSHPGPLGPGELLPGAASTGQVLLYKPMLNCWHVIKFSEA